MFINMVFFSDCPSSRSNILDPSILIAMENDMDVSEKPSRQKLKERTVFG
jgi:hypothetical protein